MGNMRVKLYNHTPQHRDNFIKLVKEGYFDDLLFHRVIPGFMVQGGDPDSRNAIAGQMLGQGGPGYTIPAEIGSPHIRGSLAAARLGDGANPQKASSGSQFYLVQGSPIDDATLDQVEMSRNMKYSAEQRQLYKEQGGTPQLDGEYTVFGMVVEGLDVIDKIANAQRDPSDRPLEDVPMRIVMD